MKTRIATASRWLKTRFAPPVFSGDEIKTQRAHVLHDVILVLLGLSALSVILSIILFGVTVRTLLTGSIFVLLLALEAFLQKGHVREAGLWLIGLLWLFITIGHWLLGGVRAPLFGAYFLVIIFAGLLRGKMVGLTIAGLSILAEIGLFGAEKTGIISFSAADFSLVDTIFLQLLLLFLAALILQLDITSRRRMVQTAYRLGERTRKILETTLDGYILADGAGQIVDVNPAYCQMVGYTRDELRQMNINDMEVALAPAQVAERIQQMMAAGRLRFETRHRAKDGRLLDLDVSIAIMDDPAGPLVAAFVRDVTGGKQAEQALRESERQLSLIYNNTTDFIFLSDIDEDGDMRIVSANKTAMRGTGFSEPELIGKKLAEILSPESATFRQAKAKEAAENGRSITFQRTEQLPGGVIEVETILTPIFDDDGRWTHVLGVSRNITEQKRAERALRESEQRFRSLVEQSQDGIAINDEAGNLVTWNAAMERITGIPAKDVIGQPIWDVQYQLLPPEAQTEERQEQMRVNVQTFLQTGAAPWANQLLEREYGRPDGQSLFVQGITFPIQTDKGFMLASITRDITAQKQAEDALRESERNYRTLFEEASDAILVLDVQSNVLDANKRASELLGIPREELLASNALAFLHEEDVMSKDHAAALALLQAGKTVHNDYRLRRSDGSYVPTELATKMLAENRFLNIARDLTERVAAEQALAESLARWESLVLNAPNFIAILDRDYRMQYLNQLQPGADLADVIGRPTFDFIAPEYHEMVREKIDHVFQTGEAAQYETKGQGAHGEPAWYETRVGPLILDGEIVSVTLISSEITERKQAEAALRRSLTAEKEARQLAETMQAASMALARTLDVNAVLSTLLDYLAELVPYDSANVMLRESDSRVRVFALQGYESWTDVAATEAISFDARQNAIIAAIIFDNESVLIPDTRQSPDWEVLPGAEHVLCWMGIPLTAGGETIGLYSVDKAEAGFFTEEHLRRAEALAAQAAVAIQQARLYAQAQNRLQELMTLQQSSLVFTHLLSPAEVGERVISVVERELAYRRGAIFMLSESGDALELLAHSRWGLDGEAAEAEIERVQSLVAGGSGVTAWVALHGETVRSGDVKQDPRYVEADPRINSELCVPLQVRGRTIGALNVESEARDAFSEHDERLLTTLANQTAVALENARLYEQIHQYAVELEQRVAERTAELEARNRELETFTYSVSHDLKAPLRGIDGYSRLLLADYEDKLDEDGRFFVQTIRKATLQMNDLIEDLLLYSRLERRTLQTGPVDLPGLVESLLAEREGELAERGVKMEVALPETAVVADRDGLMMALRNLLDNALKFTRDVSQPVIEIGGRKTESGCIIWVRDNGPGFDMKFHDRIFEIFQRLHRAEEFPGTGIGLAIVHKAMERMNGRAWAESNPGEGAAFFLEIPGKT